MSLLLNNLGICRLACTIGFLLAGTSLAFSASWNHVGPFGGRAFDLVALDESRNTIFTGTDHGIYKSVDGGDSWRVIGFPHQVDAFAITPTDPQTLYAATFQPEGVFKSVDGGRSWQLYGQEVVHPRVYVLKVSPHDPNVVLAGTSGGLYRSSDAGRQWNPVGSNLRGKEVSDITVDPTDASTAYAATWLEGLHKSTDGGIRWHRVDQDLSDLFLSNPIVDPTSPDTLFIDASLGIYRSHNGGRNWRWLFSGDVRDLTMAPHDPTMLYATLDVDATVARSTDYGHSWSLISRRGSHEELGSIVTNADRELVIGTRDGIRTYDPDDGSWTQSKDGLAPIPISSFASSKSTVFAASAQEGLLRSGDGGKSWSWLASSPRNVVDLLIHPDDPDTILAGGSSGVAKSTDGGETWRSKLDAYKAMLDMSQGQPRTLYAATGRYWGILHRSDDGGETWVELADRLPAEISGTAVAVGPFDGELVYLGTEASGLLKSTDGGQTWSAVTPNSANTLAFRKLELVAGPPTDSLFAGTDRGLWRTDNGGASWVRIRALGDAEIRDIVGSDDGRTVVAATEDGVFTSRDRGLSWDEMNEGLAVPTAGAVALVGISGGRFLVGSMDGIYWRAGRFVPSLEVWVAVVIVLLGGLMMRYSLSHRTTKTDVSCNAPTPLYFPSSEYTL